MSSPNACGNVALLLSALKAEKIRYTPYRWVSSMKFEFSPVSIEKAIVNTAKDVKDPLMVGFLQIDQAYQYFKKYLAHLDQDVFFEVIQER